MTRGSTALSADVDLVAYNVAKHMASVMLCRFLAEKGLNICDCKLLTRFDGARTLTCRIPITHVTTRKSNTLRYGHVVWDKDCLNILTIICQILQREIFSQQPNYIR